ncbi:MAG: LPS export ABC transporter periplasmic protein LptC [Bacteroidales bacterium]|nr:LPS export ABC transporter periplasmic protein LptC [Bacteroidales bacterium]
MSRMLSAVSRFKIISGLVVLLLASILFSCENDMSTVIKLSSKDSIPDIAITNINVKQTEMGKLNYELTAPRMVSFQKLEAYTEFPNGLRIVFYDSIMQPKSEITANYGISWDNKRTMEARGNVVVRNFQKHEQLNTESLVYDQVAKKVYTKDFVKITTPDRIIIGTGMESDELFDNWVIRNVTSTIFVEENK